MVSLEAVSIDYTNIYNFLKFKCLKWKLKIKHPPKMVLKLLVFLPNIYIIVITYYWHTSSFLLLLYIYFIILFTHFLNQFTIYGYFSELKNIYNHLKASSYYNFNSCLCIIILSFYYFFLFIHYIYVSLQ